MNSLSQPLGTSFRKGRRGGSVAVLGIFLDTQLKGVQAVTCQNCLVT